jgi:PAS domain S-box-containing protein
VSSDSAEGKKKYEAGRVRSLQLDRVPERLRAELFSLVRDAAPVSPALEEFRADYRIALTAEGKFQGVSPEFCRLVGYEPTQLLGKPIREITAWELGNVSQHLGAVAHFGRFEGLWMFVHREGHGVLVRASWQLLPDLSMHVCCDVLLRFF